jgi:hypothetical protein
MLLSSQRGGMKLGVTHFVASPKVKENKTVPVLQIHVIRAY